MPRSRPGDGSLNVHIGPLLFDHADYDAESDVLYLHVGDPVEGRVRRRRKATGSLRAGTQRVVGITVINARSVLERDVRSVVTVPRRRSRQASSDELAPALATAGALS